MEFDDAKSFDDLIACNVRYLNGKLPMTPYHLGELASETLLIKEVLLELCTKTPMVTVGSQPADCWCVGEDDESLEEGVPPNDHEGVWNGRVYQRGFIDGMWRGDITSLVLRLAKTPLNFLAVSHKYWNILYSSKGINDDYINLTPINGTGFYKKNFIENAKFMASSYDTSDYSVSGDKEIVSFFVMDPEFGLASDHCSRTLLEALR